MAALSNARATADLFRRFVSVTRFGAKGDGVTDDTAAIQLAIDSLGAGGGRLYFPRGEYVVKQQGTSGYCLRVIYPIHLIGDGANTTAIVPHASVPGTCDILQLEPSVAIDTHFTTIEELFFGKPGTAQRNGRHAIYVKTLGDPTPGAVQYISQLNISRIYAQGSGTGGFAFYHENNTVRNVQGGMACAIIEKSTLVGGVHLNGSGDSVRIRECILTGGNIGVIATLINAGDGPASLLSIVDNNITNDGGAIQLNSAPRTHIARNNIENRTPGAAGANGAAVIYVSGGTALVAAGVIEQNLISAFGTANATHMVRVNNADGLVIQHNTFGMGVAGMKAIKLDAAGPRNLVVGPNTYPPGVVYTEKVDGANNGNGVIGVRRTPTLLNGWTASGEIAPYYQKDTNGFVDLVMTISAGTVDQVCTLPTGYRPQTGAVERFSVVALEGGVYNNVFLLIDSAGTVFLADPTKNDLIAIHVRFLAQGAADGSF